MLLSSTSNPILTSTNDATCPLLLQALDGVLSRVRDNLHHVHRLLDNVALLDLLQGLAASVAHHSSAGMEFTRPVLSEGGPLCIVDGVRRCCCIVFCT